MAHRAMQHQASLTPTRSPTVRAVRGAQNAFINLEELSEEDLIIIKERYARMAEIARAKAGLHSSPDPTPTPAVLPE